MLSTSRPKDSLGETVYEPRTPRDEDQPAVAGTLVLPVLVGRPNIAEYPEQMRKKKLGGEVVLEGVVTQDGRFIDVTVIRTADPGFNENSVRAASKDVFQPATLDGKPVACLLRIAMTFHLQ